MLSGRHTLIAAVAMLAVTLSVRADKYCVVCGPSWGTFTCESVTGGEVGRVECGLRNPHCQVTYYDGRVCGPATFVKNRDRAKQNLKWTIFHEGCSVFAADDRRSVAEIRNCAMDKEHHNEEAQFQISSEPDDELNMIIDESIAEIQKETIQNFDWVCDHEKQGGAMHDMLAKNDIGGIRNLYANYQHHNPNAVNQLAAASDTYVRSLVNSACPPTREEKRERDLSNHPDHPDKP